MSTANLFFHILEGTETALIHKVTNPHTGESLYPDIFYTHPYKEIAIEDAELYMLAEKAFSEYGSSRVLFFMVNTDAPDDRVDLQAFLQKLLENASMQKPAFSEEETDQLTQLMDDLLLSTSLRHSFMELMRYYVEIEGEITDIIEPFRKEYALPVKNKKEGQKLYEQIRNTILG